MLTDVATHAAGRRSGASEDLCPACRLLFAPGLQAGAHRRGLVPLQELRHGGLIHPLLCVPQQLPDALPADLLIPAARTRCACLPWSCVAQSLRSLDGTAVLMPQRAKTGTPRLAGASSAWQRV